MGLPSLCPHRQFGSDVGKDGPAAGPRCGRWSQVTGEHEVVRRLGSLERFGLARAGGEARLAGRSKAKKGWDGEQLYEGEGETWTVVTV